MKTLGLLLVGLLIGAAGYAWLYAPDSSSTAAQIGAAVQQATTLSPVAPSPPARSSSPPATPPLPSPAAPEAEQTHDQPASATTPAPSSAMTPDALQGLMLPVEGITPGDLHDTFSDARSEGRVHDAIDIMAPAGTPVLAVADGTVEKLFDSKRGGLTVYQFEPSGRYAYYYAHLQRYAEGLAEKQAIQRGQVIGYVGSTGNADPAAPHLQFAIFRLGPERHWWEGEAINPYPVLRDATSL